MANFGSKFIHPGMSRKAFRRLKQRWDRKLAESGFVELESVDHSGSVNPYMKYGDTDYIIRKYNADTEEYYRLASQFGHIIKWKNFGNRAKLYELVWDDHIHVGSLKNLIEKHGIKLSLGTLYNIQKELKSMFKTWVALGCPDPYEPTYSVKKKR